MGETELTLVPIFAIKFFFFWRSSEPNFYFFLYNMVLQGKREKKFRVKLPERNFFFRGPLDGFFSATLRTIFFFRFAPSPPPQIQSAYLQCFIKCRVQCVFLCSCFSFSTLGFVRQQVDFNITENNNKIDDSTQNVHLKMGKNWTLTCYYELAPQ